jgi:hypothetical protein
MDKRFAHFGAIFLLGADLRLFGLERLARRAPVLELGTVRVRHGKGGRARTVALDPGAQAYLERWLTKRETLGLNGRQPLSAASPGGSSETSSAGRSTPPTSAGCSQGSPYGPVLSGACTPRASPQPRLRTRARRETAAGDQRPARPQQHSSHRPLPEKDRPNRARRPSTRPHPLGLSHKGGSRERPHPPGAGDFDGRPADGTGPGRLD